jgi:hypothetical protein
MDAQIRGQVINQYTLVVANLFDDDIGNRARFVGKILAAPDQRSAFFA